MAFGDGEDFGGGVVSVHESGMVLGQEPIFCFVELVRVDSYKGG